MFLPLSLIAQITHGGTPYALNKKLNQPQMATIDNSELFFIDSSYTKECSAMEFARFLEFETKLGDKNWSVNELENGDKLYRLGIYSPGALSIALYLKEVYIPKGAELFVYNPGIEEYFGSYTFENNTDEGFFNTEMISGDEIVIEYFEPKSVSGQGQMELYEVMHAYKAPFVISEKDFGDSGDCEVNVKCPEAWGKSHQRDAVIRLLIKSGNSGTWCTGTLVNNTRQDKTPYVLTADHCGKKSSTEDMLQWRFYFNYQSTTCENPENEPQHKTMIGCELISASNNTGDLGSDFFLIKLKNDIPEDYNPYFIGWSREGSVSNNGYTIHHPQGDIKKISIYKTPIQSSNYDQGENPYPNGFWKVVWAETQSGHGVTEPGSSGSPLFDSNGYLIGTLTGGKASCSALDAPDYYGKFSIHWQDNGAEEDEQLAPWLDPDNTNQLKLGGVYLDIEEFENTAQNEITLVPNPAKDNIQLLFDENISHVQVDLLHINGSVIHTYFFSNSSSINISTLPRGVYLLRIADAQKTYVQKLIKE